MKEIEIFTEAEKIELRPLLYAKQHGNTTAAIRFARKWISAHTRALKEYLKHDPKEPITTNFPEDDEFWPETVADKIEEIKAEITEYKKWLNDIMYK